MKVIAIFIVGIGTLLFFVWLLGVRSSSLVYAPPPVERIPLQAFQNFGSFLSEIPEIFSSVSSFAGSGLAVVEDVNYIKSYLVPAFISGDFRGLLSHLESLSASLRTAGSDTNAVVSYTQSFGKTFQGTTSPFGFDTEELVSFLDETLAWFKSPAGRRVAFLFQNSGELRPAGGFLGSFAELFIRDGQVATSTLRDILEADRTLDVNIVPPRPLQGMLRRWKAADANWFFDFPTSAAHVVKLLESSRLYRAYGATFDAVVAVSPRVVSDILRLTGPVSLGELGVVDADTFLEVLQKDVQIKQSSGEAIPKESLGTLMRALTSKVGALGENGQYSLFSLALTWIANKDIMVYVKEPALEALLRRYGIGGEIATFPSDDYLAVVDANVEGGKTDEYMQTEVRWESEIGTEGTVRDRLSVTRKHEGARSVYSWNHLPNADWLQIFTPSSTLVSSFIGGDVQSLPSRARYATGFVKDPSLDAIEQSTVALPGFPQVVVHPESGKSVFATFLKTPLGGELSVSAEYTHTMRMLPAEGIQYVFVFEKQAGTTRDYTFRISAPPHFLFKETQSPTWILRTGDPPGRLVVSLTLTHTR